MAYKMLALKPRQACGQKMHHKFWAKFGNSDHSVSLRFAKKKSSNRLGEKKRTVVLSEQ